jgi:hypothetical protein
MKRRLPLLGYVLLALMTAYTFSVERQHSNQNKVQGVRAARTVFLRTCEGQNDLRVSLQNIIRNGLRQIPKLEADGTISHKLAVRQIESSRDAIHKLAPRDCGKLVAPLEKAVQEGR